MVWFIFVFFYVFSFIFKAFWYLLVLTTFIHDSIENIVSSIIRIHKNKKLSNNFSLFFSLSSKIKGIFKQVYFSPQEQILNIEQLTKQDETFLFLFLFFSSRWLDLTHPWAMLAMVRLCLLTLTLPVVSKYYFSHLKDKTLHLDSVVP